MRLTDAARAVALLVLLAAGCRARPIDPPHAPTPASPSPARQAARVAVEPVSASVGTGVAVANVAGRRTAIVADEDEHAIEILDLDARTSVARAALDGAPGQILVAPGGRIFVALRERAEIAAFELREGMLLAEVARHDTGDEPWGLALSDGGATVLATTIASARLEAFAAKDLAPVFTVSLARDPRSVIVAGDGAKAFVSHASGSTLSVVDLAARSSREIALDVRERRRDFGMSMVTKPMPMPPMDRFGSKKFTPAPPPRVRIEMKRTAEQGFALAMVGDRLLLPETLVMTSDNERVPSGYGSIEQSTLGTNVPYVARVDGRKLEVENASFSGPEDRTCFEKDVRCLLPRAAVTDGAKAYVACLDTDEIEVVDPGEDAEKAPACKKTLAARTRIHVDKPSAVAFDPVRRAVVAVSSIARTVTVAAVAGDEPPVAIPLAPAKSAPSASLALGRRLFHTSGDARISSDGRACASCHVDGREDGLLWPTPKGKRQTPMLAGRIAETAPYGWSGEHPTLAVHITSTVKNLGGKGLSDEEVQALAEYVGSMKAPSRKARDGSGAIARGKAVFDSPETECASCHMPGTRFTDGDTHALETSKAAFATPSLAFVGQTAPYFHDARYRTLEELVERCDGVMGHTKHLSGDDRAALVAYLRSL